MIQALEFDQHTASFVRQLEERRRIEKNLMIELVRGAKEGVESICHDIKERVDAFERMTGSLSTTHIAPVGWSQLISVTDDVGSTTSIPVQDSGHVRCNHAPIRYLENPTYGRLSANPHFAERRLPNKSAHARAAANPSMWDNLGYVHVGYSTGMTLPDSAETLTVSIMSRLTTMFNWVEANAMAEEWYAHVAAIARLWIAYDGDFRQTPPAQLVNLLATPGEVRTHQHIDSPAPGATLAMQVDIAAGGSRVLTMYETVELVATTPNAHAYIDGVFAWEPLAIQWRDHVGC